MHSTQVDQARRTLEDLNREQEKRTLQNSSSTITTTTTINSTSASLPTFSGYSYQSSTSVQQEVVNNNAPPLNARELDKKLTQYSQLPNEEKAAIAADIVNKTAQAFTDGEGQPYPDQLVARATQLIYILGTSKPPMTFDSNTWSQSASLRKPIIDMEFWSHARHAPQLVASYTLFKLMKN